MIFFSEIVASFSTLLTIIPRGKGFGRLLRHNQDRLAGVSNTLRSYTNFGTFFFFLSSDPS